MQRSQHSTLTQRAFPPPMQSTSHSMFFPAKARLLFWAACSSFCLWASSALYFAVWTSLAWAGAPLAYWLGIKLPPPSALEAGSAALSLLHTVIIPAFFLLAYGALVLALSRLLALARAGRLGSQNRASCSAEALGRAALRRSIEESTPAPSTRSPTRRL